MSSGSRWVCDLLTALWIAAREQCRQMPVSVTTETTHNKSTSKAIAVVFRWDTITYGRTTSQTSSQTSHRAARQLIPTIVNPFLTPDQRRHFVIIALLNDCWCTIVILVILCVCTENNLNIVNIPSATNNINMSERIWLYAYYDSTHQKYLQIFLPVEHDWLGLDFAVFDVTLVATQHNWDVFTDTYKISVPIRDVLVRDACRYVKHDDSTLTW